MTNESTIEQLNKLIQTNRDAEAGFQTAVGNVRNSELESHFAGYATQHARFTVELQEEIERLGGTASGSGSLGGAVHRGWMDVKAALTGHSAASMISACENGELSAESAYLDAMEVISQGKTHTLLAKHCEQIKGFRTRLTRLADEEKSGIDFQDNV